MSIEINNILILNAIKKHYSIDTNVGFASFLGIPPTTLSSWYSRDTLSWDIIFSKCVDVDMNKLIREGIAETILGAEPGLVEKSTIHKFKLDSDSITDIQNIPLYDLEAVAGLVPLFNDTAKHVPIDFIKIPNLPRCDGAIYIVGDSMYPLLKSGDIVLYKQVIDIHNGIFWGEIYLISIDMSGEEYITVKYIQKSDLPDHIRLVSYNQHHSDKDVLISTIRALAFIKASIRINSMQ